MHEQMENKILCEAFSFNFFWISQKRSLLFYKYLLLDPNLGYIIAGV